MVANIMMDFSTPTPLQPLDGLPWQKSGRFLMKREDLRDAELGGNKWCKLVGHLQAARDQGHSSLLSVGGAWSNHLHALAMAGRRFGFETIGLIRGEPCMTPMLQDVLDAGMQIHFIPRETYRQRNLDGGLEALARGWGACWLIPEGGAGLAAQHGLSFLARELDEQTEGEVLLAVPVGSGTTFAGLVSALPERFQVWGFQAFQDLTLADRIRQQVLPGRRCSRWSLHPTSAMRTHRRLTPELAHMLKTFESEQDICLDPIYTVRMMTALNQLLHQGLIPDNTTIVALHTGGLQGRRGHGLALAA